MESGDDVSRVAIDGIRLRNGLSVTGKAPNGMSALRPSARAIGLLVLFDSGDEVTVQAGEEGIRFLLVSGKPLRNPSPGMDRS